MRKKTLLALFICGFIIIGSLIIGSKGEFGGADGEIQEVIGSVNPNYKPWFQSLWTPPSAEIESLLFALQAALGAGFIGYYIGRKQSVQANKHIIKKQ
jgi:cobalt/nickel transport protein